MHRPKNPGDLATILLLAPAVIALRWPMLLAESLTGATPRPETARALSEKAFAVAEGAAAAQGVLAASMLAATGRMFAGQFSPAHLAAVQAKMVAASLRPVARTVRANHRRLSR